LRDKSRVNGGWFSMCICNRLKASRVTNMTNDITRVARVRGIYPAGNYLVGFVRVVCFGVRHGITDGER